MSIEKTAPRVDTVRVLTRAVLTKAARHAIVLYMNMPVLRFKTVAVTSGARRPTGAYCAAACRAAYATAHAGQFDAVGAIAAMPPPPPA
ncbi:MAG: hypothetical protein LBH85_03705, partial [Treponema sp.]|nr:hypothetical protein [Treponema sp.]